VRVEAASSPRRRVVTVRQVTEPIAGSAAEAQGTMWMRRSVDEKGRPRAASLDYQRLVRIQLQAASLPESHSRCVCAICSRDVISETDGGCDRLQRYGS
jgi:hypothetical protein